MSFIQCKSDIDVENTLKGRSAFVTEDFRIYETMGFWDNACSRTLDPKEIDTLLSLRQHIEMLTDPMNEMSFRDIVSAARSLEQKFEDTLEKLGLAKK